MAGVRFIGWVRGNGWHTNWLMFWADLLTLFASAERKQQQRYARVRGYFWMPCPLCGRPFGGHEWGKGQTLYKAPNGHGTGICPLPACKAEAARRNALLGFGPLP